MGTALDGEEDWVVLCQALFQSIKEEEWIEMHEKLQQRVAGQIKLLGQSRKNAWRKTSWISLVKNLSSQSKLNRNAPRFNRRSAWRGSLLSILEGGRGR